MKQSFILLVVLVLSACSDPSIYSESVSIDDGFWFYEDAIDFNISVDDTSRLYTMDLDLNHSPEFAYQNLYLKIQSSFPDGQNVEDVISLELGDKLGRWIGKCNGRICKASFQIRNNFLFTQLGETQLSISQHSRMDSLEGISKLGLRIYPVE